MIVVRKKKRNVWCMCCWFQFEHKLICLGYNHVPILWRRIMTQYGGHRYEYKGKQLDFPLHGTKAYIIKYMEKNNLPLSEWKNFKWVTQLISDEPIGEE